MLIRVALTALALAVTVSASAENIVCPPQNDIVANFDKWSADYSGSLDEVSLSRQFLKDQEGAIIRCKRTMGSVQIMFQKRSCRIVPGAGKRSNNAVSQCGGYCLQSRPFVSAHNESCEFAPQRRIALPLAGCLKSFPSGNAPTNPCVSIIIRSFTGALGSQTHTRETTTPLRLVSKNAAPF
jgi:hypothetical protein